MKLSYHLLWSYTSSNNCPQVYPLSYPPNFVWFSFSHQSQSVLSKYSWLYGFPLEHDVVLNGYILRQNWFSLSPQLTSPNSSLDKVGFYMKLPFSCWHLGLLRFTQVFCMLSQPLWVCTCSSLLCPDDTVFL